MFLGYIYCLDITFWMTGNEGSQIKYNIDEEIAPVERKIGSLTDTEVKRNP